MKPNEEKRGILTTHPFAGCRLGAAEVLLMARGGRSQMRNEGGTEYAPHLACAHALLVGLARAPSAAHQGGPKKA